MVGHSPFFLQTSLFQKNHSCSAKAFISKKAICFVLERKKTEMELKMFLKEKPIDVATINVSN